MSAARYENPFIVQSDHTVLVEVDSPRYVEGRDALARFAELVKSPEHVHTYRITPLSIWNACAAGVKVEWIRETLRGLSKYDVPRHVEIEIAEYASRYGRLKLDAGRPGFGAEHFGGSARGGTGSPGKCGILPGSAYRTARVPG